MKYFIPLLAISTSFLLARANFTLMPYYTYAKFSSNDIKKEGHGLGLYASINNYPNKLEFDAEYLDIIFKNGIPEFEENDMTFVYSYFYNTNLTIKGGLHFVSSDYKPSNEGLSALISGVEYKKDKATYGLEGFYSNYSKYQPKDLNIFQLHPYLGYNLLNSNKYGNLYVMGDYNYIKPKDANLYDGINSSYNSFGAGVEYEKNSWATAVNGWVGKRAFALEDGGFTLYNFSQLYTSAASASVKYKLDKSTNIKLKYSRHNYRNGTVKGYCNSITTSLSHTW